MVGFIFRMLRLEGEGDGGNTTIARAKLKDNALTDLEVLYKAKPKFNTRTTFWITT